MPNRAPVLTSVKAPVTTPLPLMRWFGPFCPSKRARR